MIQSVRERCGLPKRRCAQLIEGLIETIRKTLESGEDVRISGFGKFSVRDPKKRRARDPITGKVLIPDGRREVTFKCAPVLKERINRKDL